MKRVFLLLILALSMGAHATERLCNVEVCNKLERFTLSPWSMLKDQMGEQCMPSILSEKDAVVGKVLSSGSRWYQGNSFNPTKKSVSRVKKVNKCWEIQSSH